MSYLRTWIFGSILMLAFQTCFARVTRWDDTLAGIYFGGMMLCMHWKFNKHA